MSLQPLDDFIEQVPWPKVYTIKLQRLSTGHGVAHTFNSSIGISEFEVSMIYRETSRPAKGCKTETTKKTSRDKAELCEDSSADRATFYLPQTQTKHKEERSRVWRESIIN